MFNLGLFLEILDNATVCSTDKFLDNDSSIGLGYMSAGQGNGNVFHKLDPWLLYKRSVENKQTKPNTNNQPKKKKHTKKTPTCTHTHHSARHF